MIFNLLIVQNNNNLMSNRRSPEHVNRLPEDVAVIIWNFMYCKENEQKIKQWAVEHGLNIDILNADHKHITNVTYSIVFHLRKCLVEVIDIYKKYKNTGYATNFEKRLINEFIKESEIMS